MEDARMQHAIEKSGPIERLAVVAAIVAIDIGFYGGAYLVIRWVIN